MIEVDVPPMTPEEIVALRKTLNLTQTEFGERLGVALRTVQNWEAPEGDANHRKPRGPALRVMRQLEQEAKRGKKP